MQPSTLRRQDHRPVFIDLATKDADRVSHTARFLELRKLMLSQLKVVRHRRPQLLPCRSQLAWYSRR
ncbi:hypothetical protein [Microbacterium sp. AG790]|uniref:hypothetical protein n=1 Tax=Microbacterium sp. AG790 TaxID=2183995 RepID=UPI000EAFD98A|nr:hypothetical protein [Microbacterium sp. AG790]